MHKTTALFMYTIALLVVVACDTRDFRASEAEAGAAGALSVVHVPIGGESQGGSSASPVNGGAGTANGGASGQVTQVAGQAGSAGNGGAVESDAGPPPEAGLPDVDVSDVVVEDVVVEDVVEPDVADASVDHEDPPDAGVPDADMPDVVEDVVVEDVVEPPECYESGVRVRWETSGDMPIQYADGTVNGTASIDVIIGICGSEDDLDPSPYAFECCFETEWYVGNTYLYMDFVLTDGSRACGLDGCLPYTAYSVWINGNQVTQSYGSIPSCGIQGECPHMLMVYLPAQ